MGREVSRTEVTALNLLAAAAAVVPCQGKGNMGSGEHAARAWNRGDGVWLGCSHDVLLWVWPYGLKAPAVGRRRRDECYFLGSSGLMLWLCKATWCYEIRGAYYSCTWYFSRSHLHLGCCFWLNWLSICLPFIPHGGEYLYVHGLRFILQVKSSFRRKLLVWRSSLL